MNTTISYRIAFWAFVLIAGAAIIWLGRERMRLIRHCERANKIATQMTAERDWYRDRSELFRVLWNDARGIANPADLSIAKRHMATHSQSPSD